MSKVLVTGGYGFIGSSIIRQLLDREDITDIINIDKLGVGSNINNIPENIKIKNYVIDLVSFNDVKSVIENHRPDYIIHAAAESHVDRSITGPRGFIDSNIIGTANILECIRTITPNSRLVHVSTDEVYGHLEIYEPTEFVESTPLDPRSPYSASKASSDLLVLSYINTYKINAAITRCCNNYGPYQHDEKFIPTIIRSIIGGKKVPVYGAGINVREWIYVEDHAKALIELCFSNYPQRVYNLPGKKSLNNLSLVSLIYDAIKSINGRYDIGDCIEFVEDRPGHDLRYSIGTNYNDIQSVKKQNQNNFHEGIILTTKYYISLYEEKS